MISLNRPAWLSLHFDRLPRVAVFGHLASLLVLLAACWLATRVLGAFLLSAPAPLVAQDHDPLNAAALLAASPLAAGQVQAAVTESVSHMQLVGVFASEQAQQARAIIRLDGEPKALVLAIGERIGDQYVVKQITPRRVELMAGGSLRVLELPVAQGGDLPRTTPKAD